jgi:hypothetical protein
MAGACRLQRLPQCNGSNAARCFNYAGTSVTTSGGSNLYSPKWTWNLTAAYRIEMGDDMVITPRIGYAYIGSQWAYPTYQASTDLINARPVARQHHAGQGHVEGRSLWHQSGQQVLCRRAKRPQRTVWRAA